VAVERRKTAKLFLMLRGEKIRQLTQEQRDDILERHR
jgi:hypothetical protein